MMKINSEKSGRFVSRFVTNLLVVMFVDNVIKQFSENASISRWGFVIVGVLIITKLKNKYN